MKKLQEKNLGANNVLISLLNPFPNLSIFHLSVMEQKYVK